MNNNGGQPGLLSNWKVVFPVFLILALIFGIGFWNYMRSIGGNVEVAVARVDINLDDELSVPINVGVGEMQIGSLYSDTIRSAEQLKGKSARGFIPAGTVLRESMLQAAVGPIARLKAGYVAVSVPNTINTTVAGAVKPGNSVRIKIIDKESPPNEKACIEPVEILAVNEKGVVVSLDKAEARVLEEAKVGFVIDFELLPAKKGGVK
jgi:Flp pilus assembly protein CpaB